MIYFLYGPDQYRLSKKLEEIVHRYQKIHGGSMNLVKMEAEEASFASFLDIYHQPSMFVERRLVIFRNPFQTKDNFQRQLQKEMVNLKTSPVLFVFYEEGKVNPRKPLFKKFQNYAQVQEFLSLKTKDVLTWIDQEAKSYSLALSPEVRSRLASLAQEDLRKGHLALEKLAAYLNKQKRIVDLATVEKIIASQDKFNAFGVINALQNNQISKALLEANRYLDQQGRVEFLIGQLNSFLAHLLVVRTLLDQGKNIFEIKKEVNFNPGTVNYLLNTAKRFTIQDLKEKINDLLVADRNVKTGRLSAKEAINAFLVNFESVGSTRY